jgi:hypothetical protein
MILGEFSGAFFTVQHLVCLGQLIMSTRQKEKKLPRHTCHMLDCPRVGKFGHRMISSRLEIHEDCGTRVPRAQSPMEMQ